MNAVVYPKCVCLVQGINCSSIQGAGISRKCRECKLCKCALVIKITEIVAKIEKELTVMEPANAGTLSMISQLGVIRAQPL